MLEILSEMETSDFLLEDHVDQTPKDLTVNYKNPLSLRAEKNSLTETPTAQRTVTKNKSPTGVEEIGFKTFCILDALELNGEELIKDTERAVATHEAREGARPAAAARDRACQLLLQRFGNLSRILN